MILKLLTISSTIGSIYFLLHGLILVCMANKYENNLGIFKNEMLQRYDDINGEDLSYEVMVKIIKNTKDKGICEICISLLLLVVLILA